MDNYAASFSLVVISCIMCVSIMYIYGKFTAWNPLLAQLFLQWLHKVLGDCVFALSKAKSGIS